MAAVSGDSLLSDRPVSGQLGDRPGPEGPVQVRRKHRWRYVVLVLAGIYFILPLVSAFRFSIKKPGGQGLTFSAYSGIFKVGGFGPAFSLSMRLALVTWIVTMLLMVPTTVYLHLRAPRLRRLFDGLTLLPIVIPPVILSIGVLQVAPASAKSTVYLLGLEYAVLAMPFSYRALDAGLSAVDVKTLFDASRSLGGGWIATMWRVVLPNMRSGVLSATVLTVAMVLGEYTMASLLLYQTFPVWIVVTDQTNGAISTASSLLAMMLTWVVLLAVSSLDRRRRVRRALPLDEVSVASPVHVQGPAEGAPA